MWSVLCFSAVILAIGLLGVWTLRQTERDRRVGARRTRLTAAGVWGVYVLYTAALSVVAWQGVLNLHLEPLFALPIGGVIFAFGVGLCAWGMWSMRSLDCVSGTSSDELVVGGAYLYSRNPQNVGWALALLGIAIAGASGAALVMAAVFWGVFVWYAKREERHLRDVFGDAYVRYCQTTSRYFGCGRAAQPLSQRSNHARASSCTSAS